MGLLNNISQGIAQSINFLSQIAVMGLGSYLFFRGNITLQNFIAFTSYSNQFSSSLLGVTNINSNIQQIMTSLERIFNLLDGLKADSKKFGNNEIENVKGNIEFKKVYFKYSDDYILEDLSFVIKPNCKVAIVGNNGSGKSTIFNLLLRFYNIDSGEILIDREDITNICERSIISNISIVRQEPFLFNRTIKENLLLVNEDSTHEELIKACKDACIHDYIMSLPEKYDTIINENASNFSGGQKQMLAIARAILKKSKIILIM